MQDALKIPSRPPEDMRLTPDTGLTQAQAEERHRNGLGNAVTADPGKSVWQIGNWGRLQFDGMTPEVLREIRKIIIYKALARYNRHKFASSGGKIAIAKDAELGDPEYYEKALRPDVERLDALA